MESNHLKNSRLLERRDNGLIVLSKRYDTSLEGLAVRISATTYAL